MRIPYINRRFILFAIKALFFIFLFIFILVLISYFVFMYFYENTPDIVKVYNIEKQVSGSVPEFIPIEVAIDEKIPVRLSRVLDVVLPINDTITVFIDEDFTVPVDQHFTIPIDQTFYVEADVPFEIELPLNDVNVQTEFMGFRLSFPLKGTFPVKTSIPLKCPVHIKADAKIHIKQDVSAHLQKELSMPIKMDIKTRFPIDDIFNISFPELINCRARVIGKVSSNVHLRLSITKTGDITVD